MTATGTKNVEIMQSGKIAIADMLAESIVRTIAASRIATTKSMMPSAIQAMRRRQCVNLEIIEVKDQSELADAFDRMEARRVAGVALNPEALFFSYARTDAELTRIHKLPTAGEAGFVAAGGLIAFSPDYLAMARRSAWYVDQILKGTPPGDLPAELAREYRLFVNLNTAKELGITIPSSVLARADGVVE